MVADRARILRVEYEVSYALFTCEQPIPDSCSDHTYQNAFRHVAQRLKGTHALTNLQLVFHVVYGAADAPCLYPGDDVVDVIGVSFFEGKADACYGKGTECINPNVEATLQWAAQAAPAKPLFLPESTPQDLAPGDATWPAQFLAHVEAAVERFDVRYWTYINQDWAQHGWGDPPWGDSRVQANPDLLDTWKATVLNGGRYLCLGGVPCQAVAA